MNNLQFYYAREVLGVRTALKPPALRDTYSLSRPLSQERDFLFFCRPLKTLPEKSLIKNIAKALKAEEKQVVEIESLKPLPFLLQNLLCRFLPSKGFVIFGEELANKVMSSAKKGTHKFSHSNGIISTGCVVHSISQLRDPDPAKTHANKQETWKMLHNTFLKKPK